MQNHIKRYLLFGAGPSFASIAQFIFNLYLFAIVDLNELGLYVLFVAFLGLFSEVSFLGTDQFMVRNYLECDSTKRSTMYNISIIVSLFISVILYLVIYAILYFSKSIYLAHVGFYVLISLLITNFYRLTSLRIRMESDGLGHSLSIIIGSIGFISYLIFISNWKEIKVFDLMIATIMQNLIPLIYLLYKIKISFIFPSLSSFKKALSYGFHFTPSIIADWVSLNIEKLIVQSFLGPSTLGLLGLAQKLSSYMTVIHSIIVTYWTPHMYNIYEDDKNRGVKFKKAFIIVSIVMFFSLLISVPLSIVSSLFIKRITYPVFFLTILYVLKNVFITSSYFTYMGIDFARKPKYHFYSTLASATVAIIGAYFLVKYLGVFGAAISNVISAFILFYFRTNFSKKAVPDIEVRISLFTNFTFAVFFTTIVFNYLHISIYWLLSIFICLFTFYLILNFKNFKNGNTWTFN
jgi:O-antigen/teichoic acid export membrane protein